MKSLNKGFTLIELLVVVAIIGILAAVGVVPGLRNFDCTSAHGQFVHAHQVVSDGHRRRSGLVVVVGVDAVGWTETLVAVDFME